MRNLTAKYRLNGHSIPEVTSGLEGACAELNSILRFNGRKLKPGPLLNAIVLQFINMSGEQQREFAKTGLRRLEALLEQDGPIEDNEPATGINHKPDDSPPSKPKRRS